ncbi:MAG: ATP-dependent zinc metalloprotease FtsH [Actinomycetota bacterium]
MSPRVRIVVGIGTIAVLASVTTTWQTQNASPHRDVLSLNAFQTRLEDGDVKDVELHTGSTKLTGELDDGTRFSVRYPYEYTDELTEDILAAGLDLKVKAPDTGWRTRLGDTLWALIPMLLLLGLVMYMIIKFYGRTIMGIGKSKASVVTKGRPDVKFADVAGVDEAVEELAEIRDFLAEPKRFEKTGASVPRGVLLAGPPGTGKTLLARAVAGEAGVPFFSMSGSNFVEMYAGVGAARVRDLFKTARAAAPAIVFVDEIDAVGRKRGAGVGGGHDEREQTLNQLLVELDGFEVDTGIVLIAATNRPDMLDPALLRPGRFDRQIVIAPPDLVGRRGILDVHARDKPLDDSVDLDVLARRTPGMTGADLENVLNEAALLAARRKLERVGMEEIEDAVERVIAGPERKARVMSERERKIIAYHEGGHALVAHALPTKDPVHKISIIPRGRALGFTMVLPTEDKYMRSRRELRDEMAMLMGGRSAEEIVFDDQTTGAADDIQQATMIARRMVTEFGMSDEMGPVRLGLSHDEVFVGRDMGHAPEYSDDVAARIDAEVRKLVGDARRLAHKILETHRDALDRLAAALVDKETLDKAEIQALVSDVPKWETGLDPATWGAAAAATSETRPIG